MYIRTKQGVKGIVDVKVLRGVVPCLLRGRNFFLTLANSNGSALRHPFPRLLLVVGKSLAPRFHPLCHFFCVASPASCKSPNIWTIKRYGNSHTSRNISSWFFLSGLIPSGVNQTAITSAVTVWFPVKLRFRRCAFEFCVRDFNLRVCLTFGANRCQTLPDSSYRLREIKRIPSMLISLGSYNFFMFSPWMHGFRASPVERIDSGKRGSVPLPVSRQ